MFTSRALDGMSDYIKNVMGAVVFVADSIEEKAEDLVIETVEAGIVRVRFLIFPRRRCQVSEIRIYDIDGELWMYKEENISIDSADGRFYYMLKLDVEGRVINE